MKDLQKNPLKLYGDEMRETKALKYLGDYLTFSLEDSVHTTVTKRIGIVKQTILDIRTVIEDTRAMKLGAINVAFNIWDQAICPMILQNSESWVGISKKTLRVLDDLFLSFSRKIWRVSSGAPIPNYYWVSGCLKFSNSILLRKLEFAHHLANLSSDSLGRLVYDLDDNNETEGKTLKKECQEHLDAIGVTNLRDISKGIFKRKIKKYIKNKQRTELLEDISGYKKLNHEKLSTEAFERKPFLSNLNLVSARMKYKLLSSVVPTVRSHFSRKYKHTSLACPECSREQSQGAGDQSDTRGQGLGVSSQSETRDTVDHILWNCDAYSDLKSANFDPLDDQMLTDFFTKVVKRRIDNGDT